MSTSVETSYGCYVPQGCVRTQYTVPRGWVLNSEHPPPPLIHFGWLFLYSVWSLIQFFRPIVQSSQHSTRKSYFLEENYIENVDLQTVDQVEHVDNPDASTPLLPMRCISILLGDIQTVLQYFYISILTHRMYTSPWQTFE
jgi:hypothetical protein